MARHECAMPRAGSANTRAENVFVDGELFNVLAALVCRRAQPVAGVLV